jgi:hypothetical protein
VHARGGLSEVCEEERNEEKSRREEVCGARRLENMKK